MNSHRYAKQFAHEDGGGAWSGAVGFGSVEAVAAGPASSFNETAPDRATEDYAADLYRIAPPVMTAKPHNTTSRRLHVKQFAEARLEHLSAELSKLADQIRYHHPLIAEALDDAWDATEEAIEMLSDDEAWVAGRQ
ncbi:MAG: hypothetical protein IGS50_03905 [Synechococcales cyanobacterium C42_A2020_086]|jgi:hypothetical protein|nr:hypothetical protein [Synechococcales cyanobacterium C42_A2020_086]